TVGNVFDPATTSPNLGSFVESGSATVTADSQRVETAANAIKEATIYFVSLEQTTTTVNGRVVDSDGATPVRQALATGRGQTAVADGNGAFTLRNVPARAGDQLTISVAFLRPQGRVDRAERGGIVPIIAGTTQVSPDIALPAETSNRPPVIIAPASVVANQNESRDFDFIVSDPDSDQTVQAQVAGAVFASIKPSVGPNPFRLTLAPGPGDTGQRTLTLTATDNLGASATATLTVSINRLPVVNEQTATTDEDAAKTITLTGSDPDGQSLQFVIVRQPAHGRLSGAGANLTYSPTANYNGADSFTFKAADGFGDSNVAAVFIAVRPVNDAPALTVSPALAAFTGESLIATLTATDPDLVEGQTLNFTATGLPGGATFAQLTDTSAQFVWAPGEAQVGVYTVRFAVSDDGAPALSDSRNVTITVMGRWSAAGAIEGGNAYALFRFGSKLLVGTSNGVFVSADDGQNWSASSAGLNADVSGFARIGANLFAAGGCAWRSTDEGRSWTPRCVPGVGINSLAVTGSTLFAGGNNGVYRSNDEGQNWTEVNNGLTDRRLRVLVSSGTTLFAGTDGGGVFRSTNQGQNWAPVNAGLTNLNIHSLAPTEIGLLAGSNGGGVFLSTDQGQNWRAINIGLTQRSVSSLLASGSNLFAGTYGGFVYRSTDRGQNWIQVNEAPLNIGVASLTVAGEDLLVGTFGGGVFRTSNQSQNLTATNAGLTAPIVRSLFADGVTLFAATGGLGVLRSTDRGRNWVAVNTGLPNRYFSSITSIGSTLFAGAACGGVYRSTNQGQSWTASSAGIENRCVSALAANGSALFAGMDGGGVFRSTDQGRSWTLVYEITARINALAVSGASVFAATDGQGVYRSSGNGNTWV
ncbi:MAG: Ig-like domain-containing protein, partial [Blastocatellia bacterium]